MAKPIVRKFIARCRKDHKFEIAARVVLAADISASVDDAFDLVMDGVLGVADYGLEELADDLFNDDGEHETMWARIEAATQIRLIH